MGAYNDHLVEVSKDVLKYIKSKKDATYEDTKLFMEYLSNLHITQAFKKYKEENGRDIFIPATYKYRNKVYLVAFTSLESERDEEHNIIYVKKQLKDMCDELALDSDVDGIIINPCGLNFIVDNDLIMEIYSNKYL